MNDAIHGIACKATLWLHNHLCARFGADTVIHPSPDHGPGFHPPPPSPGAPDSTLDHPTFGREDSLRLAGECVDLFEELDLNMATFSDPGRELAVHVLSRLREILQRSGVELIEGEPVFDRQRHQPMNRNPGPGEAAAIAETLSPGFAIDRRILRRAKVRLSDPIPPLEEGHPR